MATRAIVIAGASSGVGTAGVQIAKLIGARVIATTSSDEKAAKLRSIGADEVINYRSEKAFDRIRKLTDKRGVEVVFDHIGAALWDENIKLLTKGGRLVTCGATSGYEAVTDLRYVFFKQLQILGSTMGRKGDLLTIMDLIAQGKLSPVIDRVMPLADVREAHQIIEAGKHFGKIVLIPG